MSPTADMDIPVTRIQIHEKFEPLLHPMRYKVAHGGRGGLKCLAVGTKVIMFDGTLKVVEDVRIGDVLMGPDSQPRTVFEVTNGYGPLYRVMQTSGMDYVVNEAHLLSLKKSNSAKNDLRMMPSGNPRSPRGRYPNDPDIVHLTPGEWIGKSRRWQSHFRGFRAGVLHWPKQEVLCDAYLLGVWLGDGTGRELRITSADKEIIDYCRDFARFHGGDISMRRKLGQSAYDIGIVVKGATPRGTRGPCNPIWRAFKQYGLKNNKHIPHAYIHNDESVRLQLLAGLIDSDGTRKHNGYVFCQVNELLARQVKYLADTLGFRTSITGYRTRCGNNGAIGKAWRVAINGDTWKIPCRVNRKRIIRDDVHKNKDWHLSEIQIDPYGEGEWAGFTIDGDHQFLLEDGTVTHNSWQFARSLIYHATIGHERVLCTREVQKSLKESVHQLLADQIELMGLGHLFDVQQEKIIGPHNSLFIFAGLSDQTVESLKSFEGVTKVWVEEARNVTKRSWSILIPTIRKAGSEIWISFNPELDTDETYVRFVVNPPDDCVVIESNWRDNPWLSYELQQERIHCQKTESKEDYENIWEGKCRAAEKGAIWADDVMLMTKEQRITMLPYDPLLKVHTIWDFGFNDSMAVIFAQRRMSELRIIDYLEEKFKTMPDMCGILAEKRYNWGYDFIPHDGYTRDCKRGETVEDILKAYGRRPLPVNQVNPKLYLHTEEQGIKLARAMLRRTYADKGKCARLIECWKRHKRHVPKHGEPASPIHDEWSHGAAATRYCASVVERMTNQMDDLPTGPPPREAPRDRMLGGLG